MLKTQFWKNKQLIYFSFFFRLQSLHLEYKICEDCMIEFDFCSFFPLHLCCCYYSYSEKRKTKYYIYTYIYLFFVCLICAMWILFFVFLLSLLFTQLFSSILLVFTHIVVNITLRKTIRKEKAVCNCLFDIQCFRSKLWQVVKRQKYAKRMEVHARKKSELFAFIVRKISVVLIWCNIRS